MKTYSFGNYKYLKFQLVLRNLAQGNKELTRRYIRFIFTIFENRFILEWRAKNSI